MADTARWGITYPTGDDPVNGWLQMQEIAEDVDGKLGRALEVADEAARTALGVAIGAGGRGLTVLQVDTGAPWMWLGSAWLALAGSSGGGGGGTGSLVRYRAASAQQIPNSTDTVVAFGTATATHPDITRTTVSAGHGFRFERAGVVSGVAHVRYATTTASGVRHAHVVLGDNADYLGSGGGGEAGQPVPAVVPFGPVPVAQDDVLSVRCFQGTGGTRNLEPATGGRWVHLAMELR